MSDLHPKTTADKPSAKRVETRKRVAEWVSAWFQKNKVSVREFAGHLNCYASTAEKKLRGDFSFGLEDVELLPPELGERFWTDFGVFMASVEPAKPEDDK